MLRLAVDISNYSGVISPAQAEALKNFGVVKAVVQFVNPTASIHAEQIPNLLAAGIEVEGYVYIWFSGGVDFVAQRVTWACTEMKKYVTTGLMWLDCEQADTDNPPFDYVHAPVTPQIRAGIAAVTNAGLTPGIYTAAWWWIPGASNTTEFSSQGVPLWNANYDLNPDLDPVNYGGWTVPRMEQFQGSTVLVGIPMVDLDSIESLPTVDIEAVRAKLREALILLGS